MVRVAVDSLILIGNGFLVVLYGLWAHLPVVLVWPVAIGVVGLLDRHVSRRAGHRPRRHERGAVQQASSMGQWKTLGLAAVWTIAGVITPAPVPAIGLAMWLGLLIAPLLIPMEQDQILNRLKWMLAVYTAAVIGFVTLMRSELSPRAVSAWSRGLGQPGGGQALETAVVSSITPYAAAMLWVIGPLMYFAYIAQRFAVQSKTKVTPWATVEERIGRLRTRGEG